MKVFKFGGASISSAERITNVGNILLLSSNVSPGQVRLAGRCAVTNFIEMKEMKFALASRSQ